VILEMLLEDRFVFLGELLWQDGDSLLGLIYTDKKKSVIYTM
jgi:hypothetical protein